MSTQYKYSILYVEDEKVIRENYISYLKMIFNNVYAAEDGEIAYEIYKEKKPDILIVDINLPKLNGIELVKKIRECDHATKAIMLTAYADTNFLLEATSLKLTKYLVKPVSRKDLKSALNLAVEEILKFDTKSTKIVNLKNGFIWDNSLKELTDNGVIIKLTNKEIKMLSLLINNIDKTFSPNDIIFEVWSDSNEGNLDSLKTIIKNLRRKLPEKSIKNIFGIGYKLEL